MKLRSGKVLYAPTKKSEETSRRIAEDPYERIRIEELTKEDFMEFEEPRLEEYVIFDELSDFEELPDIEVAPSQNINIDLQEI